MPSISEILDSVRVPVLIKDDFIKNAFFEKTPRGIKYYSGGFTVVFPVEVNGQKWAFRCWHTDLGNVKERFRVVSEYLNTIQSPYFCDFYYCDEGIVVDGKVYPTTRMHWVKGKQLNEYIEEKRNDKEALNRLSESFLSMIDYMHEKNISHGDLQHGNIIVDEEGNLKLVDYDSLFVPGLEGYNDIVVGKAEFQHPNRKKLEVASKTADYFSELIIYLSIIAISKKPDIIEDFSIKDSLLFQSEDWADIKNSKIYNTLSSIDDVDIRVLLEILDGYLQESDIKNLRPFNQIWNDLIEDPEIEDFKIGTVDGVVYRNEHTNISWRANNCSAQYINDEEVDKNLRSIRLRFCNDTEFDLTVRNGLKSVIKRKKVTVIDPPAINFYSDKNKIKRNLDESIKLVWDVKNAYSIKVISPNNELSREFHQTGLELFPNEDTVYELIAIGLDEVTEFKKTIEIFVREASEINFKVDKSFSLPEVPVTMSWEVKNAINVKLDNIVSEHSGKIILYPEEDEKHIIEVEDEFGIERRALTIKMLPLPIIKTIHSPVPQIESNISIKLKTPRFHSIIIVPHIETTFVKLKLPKISGLKDSGLFVELLQKKHTPQASLARRISYFIKKVFNNPKNKRI